MKKATRWKQEVKQEELHLFQRVARMRSHHQVIFSLVIFFALVSLWRGAGGLIDLYFFPNRPGLSNILSLVGGLVILTTTHYLAKEFIQ